MLKTCSKGTILTPQGERCFQTVVGMYAQIQTFGRGRGRLPSLLIGGPGKAIRLHLVGKGLKTDRNIAVFQQTLHSESLQPINHVRSVSFKLFCIPHPPHPPTPSPLPISASPLKHPASICTKPPKPSQLQRAVQWSNLGA